MMVNFDSASGRIYLLRGIFGTFLPSAFARQGADRARLLAACDFLSCRKRTPLPGAGIAFSSRVLTLAGCLSNTSVPCAFSHAGK